MGAGTGARFKLDPSLDPEAWRGVFHQHGRLHVPGLLREADAIALTRGVAEASGWGRVIHMAAGRDEDIPLEVWDAMAPEQRLEIERAVRASARDSFRYMFDGIRVSERLRAGLPVDPMLASAMAFLNSEAFLGFVRRLTGDDRPAFCDAMATRYLPGHFLTAHDDELESAHRLYAYVLNLTGRWRADWGGMLLFLDDQDHVAEGYVPAFNALNIFRVPQRHAVSFVSPFAGAARLSITGWVRARAPAGWPPPGWNVSVPGAR